jgi:hypothetical protein
MDRWFPYRGLYDIASHEEIEARVAAGFELIKRDYDRQIGTILDNTELWRPPTLDEISPASPFVFPASRSWSPGLFPPTVFGETQRRATDYAIHRERAVAYGRLIGCTDEEIDRTIETHRKLEVTTPYRLDWNRIEADLRAIRFPSATLHRTFAEEDDRRGDADVQLRPE